MADFTKKNNIWANQVDT